MLALPIVLLPYLATEFPKDFVGTWKGDLSWAQAGSAKPQIVTTTLTIKPRPDGHYTYQLKYGEQPVRDYVLKAKDAAKGEWTIDEGGGVLLDQYWMDGVLTGAFSVQKSTIVSRLRRDGKNLVMEMITLENTPSYTSGEPVVVSTFRIKGTQRVILKPAKS